MQKRLKLQRGNCLKKREIPPITGFIKNLKELTEITVNALIGGLMEQKVNGVMLRAVDYKDNDKMITLYTVEKGLLSACVRGVKKAGAKLLFCAQPFCFAEYLLNVNGERATVIGATELESFYNLRLDIPAFYCATAISEFLIKCAGEEADESLFLLAVNALKSLNFTSNSKLEILASFLLKALENEGYAVAGECCQECEALAHLGEFAYFDFEKGALYCESCAKEGSTRILPATAEAMECVFANQHCEDEKLKYLLKFLNYYIELKTGSRLKAIEELIQIV